MCALCWAGNRAAPTATLLPMQSIPIEIRGNFTVTKNLSERSLGCFDSGHTRDLIGLKITLGERRILWNGLPSFGLDPSIIEISSNAFQARYGKMPQDLGLPGGRVTMVDVHPSEGIPVNAIVEIDGSKILIDACNLWLEAARDNVSGQ
jgi:hypothetical protein